MSVESLFVQLLDNGGVGLHNLQHLRFAGGAAGDGVADDTAALLEGDAAADVDTPVLARGTYRVGTATLTKQLRIRRGAVIQVPAGQVLTLPVPDAGPYPIFDTPPEAPGVRFSDAGRVRPEWFGPAAGDAVDGNAAWVAMAAAITRDGTTIWLRRGCTYPVGDAVRMDPVQNRAVVLDGIGVVLDGGGSLERAAGADPAMVVLWIGNAQDVVVNVRLGGPTAPAANLAEVLVVSQCQRVQIPGLGAADSAWHGIDLDRCGFVQWGSLQVRAPRRHGMRVDGGRRVSGGNLLVQGAVEGPALELTNGCRDVVAGTVVSIGSRDGVVVGEHGGAEQGNERIVLPTVFVSGVRADEELAAGALPADAQIATQRGLVIEGGAFAGVPNDNGDVTVGTLDVYYVLQAGIRATQLRRFTVGTLRLRGHGAAAPCGADLADCGEVMLQNGFVMGWGRMMQLLRVEHLMLRNLVFGGNLAAILATDCPRITLQGVHFKGNAAADALVRVTGSEGFAMSRLDVTDCTASADNAQPVVQLDLGATGTLGELVWRGNRGLTLSVNRPGGYEPVAAYHTDDEAWRTLALNSATPRVDASRGWVVQNTTATSLTTFAGGREGMERYVFWNDAFTTAVHNAQSGLVLIGGATRAPASGRHSLFLYRSGRWIELVYR
jgi:hypothetical protein